MRGLINHKVNGLNEMLRIDVEDDPGEGNACHVYGIVSTEPRRADQPPAVMCPIQFQDGPVEENGVNGISNEALLAIVEDRLKWFQSGEFACEKNALALHYVREAMRCLRERILDRISRGVEGTSQK